MFFTCSNFVLYSNYCRRIFDMKRDFFRIKGKWKAESVTEYGSINVSLEFDDGNNKTPLFGGGHFYHKNKLILVKENLTSGYSHSLRSGSSRYVIE